MTEHADVRHAGPFTVQPGCRFCLQPAGGIICVAPGRTSLAELNVGVKGNAAPASQREDPDGASTRMPSVPGPAIGLKVPTLSRAGLMRGADRRDWLKAGALCPVSRSFPPLP